MLITLNSIKFRVSSFRKTLEVLFLLVHSFFEQISVHGWQFAEDFKPHMPGTYLLTRAYSYRTLLLS